MAYVRVEGGARLRRTLKKAGVDMKVLRDINKRAATTVSAASAAAAPVGGPYKTSGRGRPKSGGRLKASVRPGATTKAGIIRAGTGASGRVPYAGPIHWGWPRRHIRPQPFMTLAAQATEPVWVADYNRHMRQVIQQVKGK